MRTLLMSTALLLSVSSFSMEVELNDYPGKSYETIVVKKDIKFKLLPFLKNLEFEYSNPDPRYTENKDDVSETFLLKVDFPKTYNGKKIENYDLTTLPFEDAQNKDCSIKIWFKSAHHIAVTTNLTGFIEDNDERVQKSRECMNTLLREKSNMLTFRIGTRFEVLREIKISDTASSKSQSPSKASSF